MVTSCTVDGLAEFPYFARGRVEKFFAKPQLKFNRRVSINDTKPAGQKMEFDMRTYGNPRSL